MVSSVHFLSLFVCFFLSFFLYCNVIDLSVQLKKKKMLTLLSMQSEYLPLIRKHCIKVMVQCYIPITRTCLYNFDPLKPHFYIVKLGLKRVYIIFLISAQKHRLWVLVRTASARLLLIQKHIKIRFA